jgi:hypothetical protein
MLNKNESEKVMVIWTSGEMLNLIQIEAYKDMIAPVVDAFKYLTQVSVVHLALIAWTVIGNDVRLFFVLGFLSIFMACEGAEQKLVKWKI